MKGIYILTMLAGFLQIAAPTQTPILSKEETLTLENLQLRSVLINQEVQDLNTRTKAAKDSIEQAHPGFTLMQTQQGFQLVKTPEPKKDEKGPAKPASKLPAPDKPLKP